MPVSAVSIVCPNPRSVCGVTCTLTPPPTVLGRLHWPHGTEEEQQGELLGGVGSMSVWDEV